MFRPGFQFVCSSLLSCIRQVVVNNKINIMEKIANAVKSAIEAGQNQDWTKLGTSILDIVSNGVTELSKIFGF